MSHVAVVLAAGGSSRLGRPKQLLTKDGETLVHRAVRMALATAPARTLLVLGAEADRLATAVRDLPCELVVNADWQRGLAGSLAGAGRVLASHSGSALVLACDQPRLGIDHLYALLRAAAATGVATSRYRGIVGVPAVVPCGWLSEAVGDSGEAGSDRGFGQRLRAHAATGLVDDDTLADDLDTPALLAAAIAAGWIDPD